MGRFRPPGRVSFVARQKTISGPRAAALRRLAVETLAAAREKLAGGWTANLVPRFAIVLPPGPPLTGDAMNFLSAQIRRSYLYDTHSFLLRCR